MEGKKPGIVTSLATLGSADVGSTIIGGIFWFVIATLIEPEQYGEINYLLSIVGISFTICLIGVRETIVVYTAKKNPITGEQVELLVQPISEGVVDKYLLMSYLKEKLQPHMVPKRIIIERINIGHRFKKN